MNAPLTLYETILNDKALTADGIQKEYKKLCAYPATQNKRCFAGNPLLYHFMLDVLCQVETSGGMSIKNQAENEDRRQYWYDQMTKVGRTGTFAVRFFEVVRVCRCPINFFKPTIAKYLYKQLNAQKVLDPCAGWGGRLLGAMALGIDYIGFDTNQMLRPCYGKMMDALVPTSDLTITGSDTEACSDLWEINGNAYQMVWESSLDTSFEGLDYDCVLTSPPYYNLEIYPGMTAFESEKKFYEGFLIPLIDKCLAHIKPGGYVCFNISPKMYVLLTEKYKYKVCQREFEMLQQIRFGKNKGDKIYCWC